MGIPAEIRTRLTREQHQELEEHFQLEPKPSTNDKKIISANFGVPLEKINNWFQNRRAKVKQDFRKKLMATALAKAGLDAETVQNVKGKISLPSWMGGSKSGSASPRKDGKGSISAEARPQSSVSSTPPDLSRPTSEEGDDGTSPNGFLPPTTTSPTRQQGFVNQRALHSVQPNSHARLHSSISTPNFHSQNHDVLPTAQSKIPPLPTASQCSIDPRLLTVAGHRPSRSTPSAGLNPGSDISSSDAHEFHIKEEPWSSPSVSRIQRHVTPDMNVGAMSQLHQNNSASALAMSMSLATIQSGNGGSVHPPNYSRSSVSPTPTTALDQSFSGHRVQRPQGQRNLRAAASMSVLPRNPSSTGVGPSNRMDVNIAPIVTSGGNIPNGMSGQSQTPRKGQPERTIRKVRSGVQKQGSVVGLSSVAKMQAGSHSRSVSVGMNSSSPQKQNRPSLRNMPSMPNMGRIPIECPAVPPMPTDLSSGALNSTVMPSQLISQANTGAPNPNNLGIPSPPVAECDPHAVVTGIGSSGMMNTQDIKSHSQHLHPGVGLSQLSSSLVGLTGLSQTDSPPTTPLHMNTMQQMKLQIPSTTGMSMPPYDMGICSTMSLFDSSMGDFSGFEGLSGIDSMGSFSGFGGFDPLTPIDFSASSFGPGVSSDLLFSAAVSSAGYTATTMSSHELHSAITAPSFVGSSSAFDYTPTFQLPDDPFVSPDPSQ